MEKMKIVCEHGKAKIYTPYNHYFVEKMHGVGGSKWDANNRCWIVSETLIDTVRDFLIEVYGYSDITENETVDIKIIANKKITAGCSPITLYGKTIARAFGRDSGARLGDDVTILSGEITSGGSARNWETVIKEGSIIRVNGVNKNLLNNKYDYYDFEMEILGDSVDKNALVAEKERLLSRIEEINKILNV